MTEPGIDWPKHWSDCVGSMASGAALGNILKLAEEPEIISFSGGLPDPATFLLPQLREIANRVLLEQGKEAMNYAPSLGYTRLREWIAERMSHSESPSVSTDQVIVTSGALEAIHLTAAALVNPGDRVLVAGPSYLTALHVFRAHRARLTAIPCDQEGLSADLLEEELLRLEASGERPALLYVIPSFQNPSGLTLSFERRRRIVDLCLRFSVPILEDHAYAELSFDGKPLPTLRSLAPGHVIFAHTFSKTFGPGARLGWVAAPAPVIRTLCLFKMASDQCANTLTQRLVYEAGRTGLIDEQIARSIPLYRRKRDALVKALQDFFGDRASWTVPGGGFYLWLTLSKGSNSEDLAGRAIREESVAVLPGPLFFADGRSGRENLRLSFSFVAEEAIEEGARRLARVLL